MAKQDYANAFAQFTGPSEEVVFIPALNSDVKLRKLSMDESDGFNKRLIKGYKKDGEVEFNYDEAAKIKYEKVSICLIEPSMTIEQLKALRASALEAITQINNVIEGKDPINKDEDEEEGNDN